MSERQQTLILAVERCRRNAWQELDEKMFGDPVRAAAYLSAAETLEREAARLAKIEASND